MSERTSVKMVRCPECDRPIALGKNPKQGQFIECPECSEMLEVISLNPLELDYALGGEDWEEGEEWEEEEEEEAVLV